MGRSFLMLFGNLLGMFVGFAVVCMFIYLGMIVNEHHIHVACDKHGSFQIQDQVYMCHKVGDL